MMQSSLSDFICVIPHHLHPVVAVWDPEAPLPPAWLFWEPIPASLMNLKKCLMNSHNDRSSFCKKACGHSNHRRAQHSTSKQTAKLLLYLMRRLEKKRFLWCYCHCGSNCGYLCKIPCICNKEYHMWFGLLGAAHTIDCLLYLVA